ncbi:MAG: hypothetical protein NXY57DRAFT_1090664 [Lentinula lateritia]|nr:MAG: hypothetical protein NXY57DRAFT_1090664 [Lentinula lateritia]
MLVVLLAQVKLLKVEETSEELELLLKSRDNVLPSASSNEHITFLTIEQAQRLGSLAKKHIFKPVEATTPAVEALCAMLIIEWLRPKRLLQSTAQFVHNAFNTNVLAQPVYELATMVSDEVPAMMPLALGFRTSPVALGS